MRKISRSLFVVGGLAVLFASLVPMTACTPVAPVGGASANDQSSGGEEGASLLTGAMSVSPYGQYALMQRNNISVLVNLSAKTATKLDGQVQRFIFDKGGLKGYATFQNRSVAAIDLFTTKRLWSLTPAYKSAAGALRANLSEDGKSLVLADADRILVIDTLRGDVRDAVSLGEAPTFMVMVPGKNRVLIAGSTKWNNHKPETKIYDVDLSTLAVASTVAANCNSTIQIAPDGSRAFMSPTFCEEGKDTKPKEQWTNPDPVSVVDLSSSGPAFLKNLPGFGPAVMDRDGKRLVAYLDMKRIDPLMFDDKSQIPKSGAAQFHLMVIEPKTLAFSLAPIGDALPRFAMTPDGLGLLVDSSVTVARGEVAFKLSLSPTGVEASVAAFGATDGLPVGYFDIIAQRYTAFAGAKSALDRFVQLRDGSAAYTLKLTEDGLGGDLFRLDRKTISASSLNQSLRDIGLLADGKTLLLRIRKPAAYEYDAKAREISFFRAESYCLSSDGVTCTAQIEWRDSDSFARYSGCATAAAAAAGECRCKETHDCY